MACLAEVGPQHAHLQNTVPAPAIVPLPWPDASPVNSPRGNSRHAEERGSILDGVARGISSLWLSEASPQEGEVRRASRSGTQDDPSMAAVQLAQDLKRLSSDLTGGFLQALSVQFCGSASAEKPSAMPMLCAGIDVEELLEECRDAFRQLLLDSPEPNFNASRGSAISKDDEWLQSLDAFPELMRPADGPSAEYKPALQRKRLIGHVCNCFRAVQRILKGGRVKLWIQFVSQDEHLQCALPAQSDVIYDLLEVLAESPETAGKMAKQLCRRAAQAGEVDFADILDVVETEHETSRARFSLGNSLGRLVLGNNEGSTSSMESSLSQETAKQLRRRCREKPVWKVTGAAAAYQRSLILTASWQAEQMLRGFLAPSNASETPESCNVLLCILRGIRSELAPVERLMWELLAKSSRQVDGSFARMDVLTMLSEMQQYVLEKERSLDCFESDEAENELRELRAECQQQAANEIFAVCPEGQHATLPDCLAWWRGNTDEYREAMGLDVPLHLLQQHVHRQPEEMFRNLLWCVATDAEAARTALLGYSNVFSELRALDVRHAIAASFTSLASAEQDSTTTEAGPSSRRLSADVAAAVQEPSKQLARRFLDEEGGNEASAIDRALLLHDLEGSGETRLELNAEPLECSICITEAPVRQAVRLHPCNHGWYCMDCVQRCVCMKVADGCTHSSLRCPEHSCGRPFSERVLRALLTREQLERMYRRDLEVAVDAYENIRPCPTPDCPNRVVLEDGIEPRLLCSICEKEHCLLCSASPFHTGKTCEEHRACVRAEEDAEASLHNWMAEVGAKQCPSCRSVVTKNNLASQATQRDECHKMICRSCRVKFCFGCLAILTESSTCGCTPDNHGFIDPETGRFVSHGSWLNFGGLRRTTTSHVGRYSLSSHFEEEF